MARFRRRNRPQRKDAETEQRPAESMSTDVTDDNDAATAENGPLPEGRGRLSFEDLLDAGVREPPSDDA